MSKTPDNTKEQSLNIAFPTESDPDENAPWADDSLNRRVIAERLTTIVNNIGVNNSLTLSLHGEWGTGKTFMLKRWGISMEKTHHVIYFNAWKNDFIDDPIVAIIGQISEKLRDDDLKEIGNSIMQGLIPASAKVLNIVGLKKSDMQSWQEKTVDNYIEISAKTEDLKIRLSSIAKERPIIFIVDEIDRCMPIFAVKTLERVKHLFSVPGIVFVFGVNKTTLKESIRKIYGNIDGDDYLRRFFHLDMSLPPATQEEFANSLFQKHGILNFLSKNQSAMSVTNHGTHLEARYASMFNFFNMNLREIEHTIRMLRLFLVHEKKATKAGYPPDSSWLVFSLIILKIKNYYLYSIIKSNQCSCKDAIDGFLQMLPPTSETEEKIRILKICKDSLEEDLYHAMGNTSVWEALSNLAQNQPTEKDLSLLAKRTLNNPENRANRILDRIRENRMNPNQIIPIINVLDLGGDYSN